MQDRPPYCPGLLLAFASLDDFEYYTFFFMFVPPQLVISRSHPTDTGSRFFDSMFFIWQSCCLNPSSFEMYVLVVKQVFSPVWWTATLNNVLSVIIESRTSLMYRVILNFSLSDADDYCVRTSLIIFINRYKPTKLLSIITGLLLKAINKKLSMGANLPFLSPQICHCI